MLEIIWVVGFGTVYYLIHGLAKATSNHLQQVDQLYAGLEKQNDQIQRRISRLIDRIDRMDPKIPCEYGSKNSL